MPDVDGVSKIQRGSKFAQIIGVGIEIVSFPRLVRTPMTAAVERDAAEAARTEIKYLIVPIVRCQRPAVTENDGLISLTEVLVEDLNSVPCSYKWHVFTPWS